MASKHGHAMILLSSVLLLTPTPLWPEQLQYTFVKLGPLPTEIGELDQIRAREINDAGQVVGTASKWIDLEIRSAAFRYTPGVGLEDLDPTGSYTSGGVLINNAGHVYGGYLGQGFIPVRLFRYSDEGGFDHLEKGLKNEIRRRFRVFDMNEAGDLVGTLLLKGRFVPYFYSDQTGWVNLTPLDPSLRQRRGVPFIQVNDRGHIALSESFLLRADSVVDIDFLMQRFGGDAPWPIRDQWLGDSGHLVGVEFLSEPGPRHVVLFSPGKGLLDIHPRGFRASDSSWISDDGVVTGTLWRESSPDTLFTYDEDRIPRLRVEARLEDFQQLNGGEPFLRIAIFDVNNRQETVGVIRSVPNTWFLYRAQLGLVKVQDVVNAAGSDDIVVRVLRINNRGEILLLVRPPGSPDREIPMVSQPSYTRMMVLSPSGG